MEMIAPPRSSLAKPALPKKSKPSAATFLAHDTRNWLTVLQMYCDLLRTGGAGDARFPDWIEELSAAVDRGQALVISLIESAQSCHDQGREPQTETLRPEASRSHGSDRRSGPVAPLDLAAAVTGRLAMLQRMAGAKVHIYLQMETEMAQAAIAESDFDRILQNLARNAIEAMPQGGELQIALSSLHLERSGTDKPSCGMVLLRVTDTGSGISPSLLPHIFQPGVSGKKLTPDDREEHGLGLTAVRDIALRAGGSVRVCSHGGQGTCFEVELPAAHLSERQSRLFTDHLSLPRTTTRTRGWQDRGAGRREPGAGKLNGSSRSAGGGTASRTGIRPATKVPLRRKA